MDDKMGNIKYVQLEAGDFLADPDFQLMTDAERGIYCSIIFYMYLNDGKILNDTARIKALTNSSKDFEKNWKTVRKKFGEKNGYLTHRRVRKELAKAKRFIQHQRNAGLASAAARQPRFNHGSTTVQPSLQPNKRKESKTKQKSNRGFQPPTIQEISDYCKEKNIYVDPKDFIQFYSSKGWMVGKNKMKDWRSAVCRAVKWETNQGRQPKPPVKKTKPVETPPIQIATPEQRKKIAEKARGIGKRPFYNFPKGSVSDRKQKEINKLGVKP